MHYQAARISARSCGQSLDAATQYAAGRPSPSGMQQRDASAGCDQINRYAVGNGDTKENAGCGSDPAVHAIDVHPTASRLQVHQLDTVHLVPQGNRLEVVHATPEGQPAAHDLPNRLVAPETQIEAAPRLGPATRNTP
jgi:hypothetical protein